MMIGFILNKTSENCCFIKTYMYNVYNIVQLKWNTIPDQLKDAVNLK